jgi:hypothetical protein
VIGMRAPRAAGEPLPWDQALRWGGRNVAVLLAGVLPSILMAGMAVAFVAGEGGGGPGADTLVAVAYFSLLLLFPAFPVAVAYVGIVLCVARRNPDAGRAVAILLPGAATLAAAPAMAGEPLLVPVLLGMSLACGAAIQLDPRRTLGEVKWVWLTELSLALLVMLFSVVPA